VTRRGWLLFLALSVIWGLPYFLIKIAVRELTPASLVFLRTTLGTLLLLPAVMKNGNLRALLPRWRAILLFTVVEVALPWWLLSDAERRISSSLSGLLVASVSLIGALLSRLTGAHEPLGTRRLAGLGAGFAGVVALLGLDLSGDVPAIVEMTLVVLGYALGPLVISRRLADLPSLDVVTVSIGLCALVYAPVGIAQLPPAMPSPAVIGAVAVLGVACTAAAFLLFFRLIAEVGPVRATVITYVNPAIALLAGVTLLGEPFTPATAAGFVLIIAGSWLATGPSRRTPRRVAPTPRPPTRRSVYGRLVRLAEPPSCEAVEFRVGQEQNRRRG
jgi:drug/metabolite transporter (DMT)-like permease